MPALFEALEDPDEAVRHAAARALSEQKLSPDDIGSLERALGSADTYVRGVRGVAPGQLRRGAAPAVPALAAVLEEPDTHVVVSAALARIGPGPAEAVPALLAELASPDAGRRWRAAKALGRIGPAAAPAVAALAEGPVGSQREGAPSRGAGAGPDRPGGAGGGAELQRATGDRGSRGPARGPQGPRPAAAVTTGGRLESGGGDQTMNDGPCVQERYAPENHCFGCGPANPKGLRIRSFEDGEVLRAEWTPEPHHEAFDGMLNGGIIGTLLDCHSNWAAALHLMKAKGLEIAAVHGDRGVPRQAEAGHARPTGRCASPRGWWSRRATGRRWRRSSRPAGRSTATCRGVFVAVREGHPAYHRW